MMHDTCVWRNGVYTHTMVTMLTLSNVSRCARSNASLYLSILSAVSQSLTVATDDRSVGVGLSSGWEQLLWNEQVQGQKNTGVDCIATYCR